MELRNIAERADRKPFRPFTLEFDNGRRCTVRHPENIVFWPNRLKLLHVIAYDEEQDFSVYFEPVAVSTILEPVEGGGDPPAHD